MNISISSNSWHARLYRWFYKDNYMPRSLCPYFWALLLAIVCFVPLIAMALPLYIINVCTGEKPWLIRCGQARFSEFILGIFIYAFLIFLGFACVFIFHWITGTHYITEQLACFLVLVLLLIGIGVIKIIGKIQDYYDARDDKKYLIWLQTHSHGYRREYNGTKKHGKSWSPKNWLLTKFIIAIYTKMCPLIKWK